MPDHSNDSPRSTGSGIYLIVGVLIAFAALVGVFVLAGMPTTNELARTPEQTRETTILQVPAPATPAAPAAPRAPPLAPTQ